MHDYWVQIKYKFRVKSYGFQSEGMSLSFFSLIDKLIYLFID